MVNKNSVFSYIKDIVRSLDDGISDILKKVYYHYNLELERVSELTLVGIKGRLISHQLKNEIISNIIVEYGILKEPFSEPKEAHEVQWELSLNKEIHYKGIINQLEDNFEFIQKKIGKLFSLTLADDLLYKKSVPECADIEIDVMIGTKSFHRSVYY